MSSYIRLEDLEHKIKHDPQEEFALDVLMGLTSEKKYLSPKYLYDSKGSVLFQNIMSAKDYYPTNCEADIFSTHSEEISKTVADCDQLNVVELGAGDGSKTKILLESLVKHTKELRYVPVDISESAVEGLTAKFSKTFPTIEMRGVVSEYFDALRWLSNENQGKNLVLFLGSNIGNFNTAQAEVFLKTMWNTLNDGDYLLIGCDLKKDIDVMLRAYNDSDGYTRAFNLNLLSRMNRELDANFNIDQYDHFGTYNVKLGAMESFILSKTSQTVTIGALNKSFSFKPYEAIHVEFSFKYLESEIDQLAIDTGYEPVAHYTDEKGYFVDAVFRVKKIV